MPSFIKIHLEISVISTQTERQTDKQTGTCNTKNIIPDNKVVGIDWYTVDMYHHSY